MFRASTSRVPSMRCNDFSPCKCNNDPALHTLLNGSYQPKAATPELKNRRVTFGGVTLYSPAKVKSGFKQFLDELIEEAQNIQPAKNIKINGELLGREQYYRLLRIRGERIPDLISRLSFSTNTIEKEREIKVAHEVLEYMMRSSMTNPKNVSLWEYGKESQLTFECNPLSTHFTYMLVFPDGACYRCLLCYVGNNFSIQIRQRDNKEYDVEALFWSNNGFDKVSVRKRSILKECLVTGIPNSIVEFGLGNDLLDLPGDNRIRFSMIIDLV